MPAPQPANFIDRIRSIQPYEVLIFFILLVLLALCVVVAKVVTQDVDGPHEPHAVYRTNLSGVFKRGA